MKQIDYTGTIAIHVVALALRDYARDFVGNKSEEVEKIQNYTIPQLKKLRKELLSQSTGERNFTEWYMKLMGCNEDRVKEILYNKIVRV